MKILVPVDLTQRTDILDLVAYTAHRLHAEVQLFTVVPPGRAHSTFQFDDPAVGVSPPPSGDMSGGIIRPAFALAAGGPAGTMVETRDQALDRLCTAARERLQLLAGRLPGLAVQVEAEVHPHVAAAIADYVARTGGDLLVMRTHGHAGLRRALLGSVAEAIVRTVDLPVILVGPSFAGAAPAYDDLVVCLDGGDASEEILPLARWVRSLNLHVTVVTAVASGPGSAAAAEAADYVKLVGKSLRGDGVNADWAVIPGLDPAAAITGYVAERPTSMVALITRARTGLARLVGGSVAMRVVHDSPNPVLVMHAHRANGARA